MATITIDLAAFGKTVVIVAFAVVIFGILALLVSSFRRWLASRAFDPSDRVELRRRWSEIESFAAGSGEVQRKLAVIEADKLLDHALKALAMPGTTLGERLKFAQYNYPKLRDVWWAHKVRNQLVHEASYHLDSRMAKSAVREFKKALAMLGAI